MPAVGRKETTDGAERALCAARGAPGGGYTRLRPIVTTTSAMVLAMLPLALTLEVGSETRSSMAVVVIGGLLTSTLLTLFVVPAGYTLMDDLQAWVLRLFRRQAPVALPAPSDPAAAAPVRATSPEGALAAGRTAAVRHESPMVVGGSGE